MMNICVYTLHLLLGCTFGAMEHCSQGRSHVPNVTLLFILIPAISRKPREVPRRSWQGLLEINSGTHPQRSANNTEEGKEGPSQKTIGGGGPRP